MVKKHNFGAEQTWFDKRNFGVTKSSSSWYCGPMILQPLWILHSSVEVYRPGLWEVKKYIIYLFIIKLQGFKGYNWPFRTVDSDWSTRVSIRGSNLSEEIFSPTQLESRDVFIRSSSWWLLFACINHTWWCAHRYPFILSPVAIQAYKMVDVMVSHTKVTHTKLTNN